MKNTEYTTMYDDIKEEIIAKLKVLSDTKRMMLLNKYARQTENIYCTFSAEKNLDIINIIFILKFDNDALVDAYKNEDPVVDYPGFRLNEFLNNELA